MKNLTKQQIEWAFSEEAIREFSDASGAFEVHRSWRDTMLSQSREVADSRMKFGGLSQQDIELDRQIAFDVISDYIVYIGSHDKDGNHI